MTFFQTYSLWKEESRILKSGRWMYSLHGRLLILATKTTLFWLVIGSSGNQPFRRQLASGSLIFDIWLLLSNPENVKNRCIFVPWNYSGSWKTGIAIKPKGAWTLKKLRKQRENNLFNLLCMLETPLVLWHWRALRVSVYAYNNNPSCAC